MIDVVEILQHWYAGRCKAEVAASVGADRGTVRKYVAPAEAEGIEPGGPSISRAEWIERVQRWFPELVDAPGAVVDLPGSERSSGPDQGVVGRGGDGVDDPPAPAG